MGDDNRLVLGMLSLTLFILLSFGVLAGSGIKTAEPGVANFQEVKSEEHNLFTGDLTKSFDLMNVPGRSVSVPITLNYQAGIRADQEASWTGLGFNLQLGAITRSVNNEPDESSSGSLQGHTEKIEYEGCAQDSYYVTFAGGGGRIVLDYACDRDWQDEGYYTIPVTATMQSWQPWKIDVYDYYGNKNAFYRPDVFLGGEDPNYIAKWEITTEDGTVYVFDGVVESKVKQNTKTVATKSNSDGACTGPIMPGCGDGFCDASEMICENGIPICYECVGQFSCTVHHDTPDCRDGRDNDDDGCIDMEDNDCTFPDDTIENGTLCRPKRPGDIPTLEDAPESGITGAAVLPIDIPPIDLVSPLLFPDEGRWHIGENAWPLQQRCSIDHPEEYGLLYTNTYTDVVAAGGSDWNDPVIVSWQLTAIKGHDYKDNGDAVIDDMDTGGWAKISYETNQEWFESWERYNRGKDPNPADCHDDYCDSDFIDATPLCRQALKEHPWFDHDVLTNFRNAPRCTINATYIITLMQTGRSSYASELANTCKYKLMPNQPGIQISYPTATEGFQCLPEPYCSWVTFWNDPGEIKKLDCEWVDGAPKVNGYRIQVYTKTISLVDLTYPRTIETPTHVASFSTSGRNDIFAFDWDLEKDYTSQAARKLDSVTLYAKTDAGQAQQDKVGFSYDSNYPLAVTDHTTQSGTTVNKGKLTLLKFWHEGNDSQRLPATSFSYGSNPDLVGTKKYAVDWLGYYNGITTNINGPGDDRSTMDVNDAWSLRTITYPTGLMATYTYEPDKYSYVQTDLISEVPKNAPGIRVSSITTNNGIDEPQTINYEYSGGVLTEAMKLKHGIANPFSDVSPGSNTFVMYSQVTKVLPGGYGTVTTHFDTAREFPDQDVSDGRPHAIYDYIRGQITNVESRNDAGIIVSSSSNVYDKSSDINGGNGNSSACVGYPTTCASRLTPPEFVGETPIW
ncbi:MAG: hypothetical protein ABIA93_00005, partial [Candidatus Woesearchaeota archaeon]